MTVMMAGRVFCALLFPAFACAVLSPVVFVPGTGGSTLEAKVDKPSTVHFYCTKKSDDWFTLWLSVTSLLPGSIDCWCDNIRLVYADGNYSNSPGVQTRTKGAFGDLDAVLNLGPAPYFKPLAEALEKAGLERGASLFAAPYDFRFAPSSHQGAAYVQQLKALIEETSAKNDGSPVTLLSHSMGCLYALFLLNTLPGEWKDRYIHKWIPTSGVFAGSVNEIRLFASGNPEGVPLVKGSTLRDEQRSYESNFWLLPTASVFGDMVLGSTPMRNYTALDYDTYFEDIDFAIGKEQLAAVRERTASETLAAPGVATVHFYGLGVDTDASFVWASGDFEKDPSKVVKGDGDGTVPRVSLESVERWAEDNAEHGFRSRVFKGQSHNGILSDDDYVAALLAELQVGSDEVWGS